MNDLFLGGSLWIYFIDGSPVDFPTQFFATSENNTALWFQTMVQFSAIGMAFVDPPIMRSYLLDVVMELKKKKSWCDPKELGIKQRILFKGYQHLSRVENPPVGWF